MRSVLDKQLRAGPVAAGALLGVAIAIAVVVLLGLY